MTCLIITGDEICCFLYDPQLKRQSAIYKTPVSPRQKKNHDKTGQKAGDT